MFCLPAETAHYFSMGCFSMASKAGGAGLIRKKYTVNDPRLAVDLFGLRYANPIGLAAGFDKDAKWHHQLINLGFSHIEVGTLTGQPQPGNPKPRLFRLPKDKAIINRMGFNNGGSLAAAERLQEVNTKSFPGILGINIGKTKVVELSDATSDYLVSFERLFPYADYFTINVSSPNTPGLRQLQNREPLIELINSISDRNRLLADAANSQPRPVLLKVAPDLNEDQIRDIAEIANSTDLAGIIATNTTIEREPLVTPKNDVDAIGAGGLSGGPLTCRSRQIVASLYELTGGSLPIIGVGGIMNGEDAWQMILAGASLVQVYTGFIYGGPSFIRDINQHLLKRIEENNLSSIGQAVGGGSRFD